MDYPLRGERQATVRPSRHAGGCISPARGAIRQRQYPVQTAQRISPMRGATSRQSAMQDWSKYPLRGENPVRLFLICNQSSRCAVCAGIPCCRGTVSKGDNMQTGRPEGEARKRVLAAMGSWAGGPLHVRGISRITGFPDTPSLRSVLSDLAMRGQIEHVGSYFYLPCRRGQESR